MCWLHQPTHTTIHTPMHTHTYTHTHFQSSVDSLSQFEATFFSPRCELRFRGERDYFPQLLTPFDG